METIETSLAERARLASWYAEALRNLKDDVVLPKSVESVKQVHWMYNIFLRKGDAARRDEVMRLLSDDGIETRPVFYPMHVLPPYKENGSYPVADLWAQRGINLPTHLGLTREDVERVANSLGRALKKI
jgi:perosamine synthetase